MDRSFSHPDAALPYQGYYAVPQSATALRSQRWLRAFILAAVFLATWRVFRWSWTNFTYSDVFLVLAGLILLGRGQLNFKPFAGLSSLWYLGFAAMMGGLLLGSLVNGEPARWFIGSSQYFFAFVLAPMLFASLDRPVLLQSVKFFVVAVAISQVIGMVAAQFFDWSETYWTIDHGFLTPNGRIGALSGEPNLNGAACAFGAAMLAYLHLSRSVSLRFAIPCGVAIGWGLLMSASVTGFTATSLALIVMIASSGVSGVVKFGVPMVLIAACYVLLGGPLPEVFAERVGGALATGDINAAGTFVERSYLITEAWGMLDRNLLIGLGMDGYRDTSPHGLPVHNLFLLVSNEGGLLAIAGLFTLLGILLACFLSFYRWHRLEGGLGLAVLGVFIVFANAIPHMYTRMWTVPIFLGLALAFQTQQSPRPTPAR